MLVPLRVVKLGGSLLAWSGLREALRAWRSRQAPAIDVLVVGGGVAADWIRQADQLHELGDDAAHQLAIQAMQLNARLAEAIWPEALTLTSLEAIRHRSLAPGLWILQPWPALADAEQAKYGAVLPHTWNVTSDSIAAWVAQAADADELVLLKSDLPPDSAIGACAASGYVDRYFPAVTLGIPMTRAVHLRSIDFAEALLR